MRALSLLVAVTACGGAPATGTRGDGADQWTFPLVGALEEGLLITPVSLDGRGPFLFAFDPDAVTSAVDEEVVKALQLPVAGRVDAVAETGEKRTMPTVGVPTLELGTLAVPGAALAVVPTHVFDSHGRRIHGVIGRDVLRDDLVLGFDRLAGIATLARRGSWKPTLVTSEIPFASETGTGAAPRRIVEARLGDSRMADPSVQPTSVRLHVDLGASVSQLRETKWSAAALVARPITGAVVDETGARRRVSTATTVPLVFVANKAVADIEVVPYDDRRFPSVDGTLGLGWFGTEDQVWLDTGASKVWLTTRKRPAVGTRIARWDVAALDRCAPRGCVTVRLTDPLGGKAAPEGKPHPGLVLSAVRDPSTGGTALEVVLEARDKPELPRIAINLPPDADRAMEHLKAEWVGVQLDVVDLSPHPRPCPAAGGCIDLLAR